ncbi:reverse transcriptase domain-containing protein [Tanacetum coccineum]
MTLELADRLISRPIDFEPDPRVPLILGRCFLKTGRALIDVYEGELTLRVDNEAITYNLDQTSRYSVNYNDMTANRIDVVELACEEYSQEVLGFSDVIASGNPTPGYDPIVSNSSPTLTPFGDSDFLLLEEVDAFLALADDPTSPEELKICEDKTAKSLIDEPPEVELKDLPPHLEYAFLEDNNKLPVIIAKDLSVDEKTALIKLPHQRRVNPKIHDVIKKEVEKLLDAGLIYPISDSPWVSPVHCVPKKGGMIVVTNDENELVPTRLVTGWRVCIDYRKLNEATRKDTSICRLWIKCSRDSQAIILLVSSRCFSGPFQRCMMAIFHDMIEKTMEVFMDDFSVFGNSFSTCLSNLEKMLKRCEDTNLALNWEKSHFMVKEAVVL